jgi:hypothetical protein
MTMKIIILVKKTQMFHLFREGEEWRKMRMKE